MSNSIPRIRTIQQCLVEIKTLDSNSCVTENFIRLLCKSGQVNHFKSNSKFLVNLDDLLRYLNGEKGEKENG